jgi:hypothetical protein
MGKLVEKYHYAQAKRKAAPLRAACLLGDRHEAALGFARALARKPDR